MQLKKGLNRYIFFLKKKVGSGYGILSAFANLFLFINPIIYGYFCENKD